MRVHKDTGIVLLVITLLACGCPPRAIRRRLLCAGVPFEVGGNVLGNPVGALPYVLPKIPALVPFSLWKVGQG